MFRLLLRSGCIDCKGGEITAPFTRGLKPNSLPFWRGCMAALAILGALVALCGQDQTPAASSKSGISERSLNAGSSLPLATQDYVISPDDELEINMMDVPELSLTYRVSPTGLITVSVLKEPILAAGLTLERFTQVLAKELQAAGMVENPRITIRVKQSRLNSVAITGAVKRPQIYEVFGPTTLLALISQAEGLAPDAGTTATVTRGPMGMRAQAQKTSEVDASNGADARGTFTITRGPIGMAHETSRVNAGNRNDAWGTTTFTPGQMEMRGQTQETSQVDAGNGGKENTPQTVTVDLQKLVEEGDASLNLVIYPGDQVTVQRASIVYVVGAVNRAGGFELVHNPTEMTVLKAIALAQSLTPTASAKKAVIIRDDPVEPGGKQQIPIRLDQILKGKVPDVQLLAQDVLFVPDSASKRMMLRAGEAAWQAAVLSIYLIP